MTFKTEFGEYETAEDAIKEVVTFRLLDILLSDPVFTGVRGENKSRSLINAIVRNRAIIARALTRDVDFID